MELKTLHTNNILAGTLNVQKQTSKMNIDQVFGDVASHYINPFNLFAAHFNTIPNFAHEIKIDCTKANEWFKVAYESEIRDVHFDMRYFNNNDECAQMDDIFYLLLDDLIIHFDTSQSIVRFLFRQTNFDTVKTIIDGVKKFRKAEGCRAQDPKKLFNKILLMASELL
jgi:hypothetical protein